MSYADVLSGRVVPGRRVAVIGAGGIGVDVSHWLTHDPADTVEDWMAHWGVGDPSVHPGGLTERKPRTPVREVTLLQRKTTPIGIGLGKTSGWAHRAVLKQSGVVQVSGVAYDRVEDRGAEVALHHTVDGEARVLDRRPRRACAPGRSRCAGCTTSWSRPGTRRCTWSAAPTWRPSSTPSARSSRARGWPPRCSADAPGRGVT